MSPLGGFLRAVLGPGAQTVARLAEDPVYAGFVAPRTILAWLREAGGVGGQLPGTDVPASLRKSDQGWGGSVGSGSLSYSFSGGTDTHAAAAVLTALGVEVRPCGARGSEMARLGRTLDALVKGQAKQPEGHGPVAKPQVPVKADGPNVPDPAQRGARLPRQPVLKASLSEAQAKRPCGVCGGRQLRDGKWAGCSCLKGLAKAEVRAVAGGYALTLPGWTRDDVAALRAAVGETK